MKPEPLKFNFKEAAVGEEFCRGKVVLTFEVEEGYFWNTRGLRIEVVGGDFDGVNVQVLLTYFRRAEEGGRVVAAAGGVVRVLEGVG